MIAIRSEQMECCGKIGGRNTCNSQLRLLCKQSQICSCGSCSQCSAVYVFGNMKEKIAYGKVYDIVGGPCPTSVLEYMELSVLSLFLR